MNLHLSAQDDNENVLPNSVREAFENYPRLQPSIDFNRAVLQSLDLEKMRRRSTLVGRIEEFLGLGIWQFASSGALGALIPAFILASMLAPTQATAPKNSFPEPLPDPLNLNLYGPLYAREIFENHSKAAKKSVAKQLQIGELWPDSKFQLA